MPEAVLLESLREQAERAGYLTVILSANHTRTGSVDVDHQGRTMTSTWWVLLCRRRRR
jgi:hypothetical protein